MVTEADDSTVVVANTVTFSTPANFASAVAMTYKPTALSLATSVSNRGRYLIADAQTESPAPKYLEIGAVYDPAKGYAVASVALSPTASTYKDYLSKTIQWVQTADSNYRMDAHLHPNNSIDADSADNFILKFRNNFGKATSLYGYVSFSYDTASNFLQAKRRYIYSYDPVTFVASYTEDPAFAAADHYVNLSGGVYKLVASRANASRLYLFSSPLIWEFLSS